MSEYQYYEFVAIDRPLTAIQQQELREITSRATITSTRLVNEYHWGDFRGDPLDLLGRYFDAHLYYANWGSRALMFAFPRHLVDLEPLEAYADDEFVRLTERGERVIVELWENEGEGWWDEENEAKLVDLLPLRADIISGDLRALYLVALKGLGIWLDDIDLDEELEEEAHLEPPLPAGLRQLTPPLQALIELLEVDRDLIAAAAEASPYLPSAALSEQDLERWIRRLAPGAKDDYLVRVARGEQNIPNELRLRFYAEQQANTPRTPASVRREAAALIGRAEKLRDERRAAEAERRDAEAARLREERVAHLDRLRGSEQQLWGQADALARTKKVSDYDRAIAVLTDLRDLARGGEQWSEFLSRLHAFRDTHVRKPSLMQRLDQAGLR